MCEQNRGPSIVEAFTLVLQLVGKKRIMRSKIKCNEKYVSKNSPEVNFLSEVVLFVTECLHFCHGDFLWDVHDTRHVRHYRHVKLQEMVLPGIKS